MKDQNNAEVDVIHIAELARLKLSETERQKFQGEIGAILGYAESLSVVDVEGVEPTAHATSVSNVSRVDKERVTTPRDEILENAPAVLNYEHIRVPVVISDTGEGDS